MTVCSPCTWRNVLLEARALARSELVCRLHRIETQLGGIAEHTLEAAMMLFARIPARHH